MKNINNWKWLIPFWGVSHINDDISTSDWSIKMAYQCFWMLASVIIIFELIL